MSLTKVVEYVSLIVGVFMHLASFSSDEWIVTSGPYRWGLLSVCEPHNSFSNGTVYCTFIGAGDSEAYFEASRFFACVSSLMYVVLLFHFFMLKFRICFHQLPAILSACVTVQIALVVVLVGSNYDDDSTWEEWDVSLGWSYWLEIPALICSVLSTAMMVYSGRQEHSASEAHKQIHPTAPSKSQDPEKNDNQATAEAARESTASGILKPQSTCEKDGGISNKQRKRRLSPIRRQVSIQQEAPVDIEASAADEGGEEDEKGLELDEGLPPLPGFNHVSKTRVSVPEVMVGPSVSPASDNYSYMSD